jgi:CBS domain containing-hemolysin-like protein
MTLLVAYVSAALTISFGCSILEATLLSARTADLLDRKGRKDRGAALLLELKRDRLDESIGAILTLNTIAHTVGSTLAGAQAAVVFGDAWVGVFSGVLTFLVLVVTEIIPKTLGTTYASQLTRPAAYSIEFLTRLLRPILAAIRLMTGWLLPKGSKPQVSRRQVAALAAAAAKEGAMSTAASRTVENVLLLRDRRLEDVLVPRTVVAMVREDTTIEDFLVHDEARTYARVPLYSSVVDDASTYVLQRDVLAAAVAGRARDTPLSEFARAALLLPETTTVEGALEQLNSGRENLALVFDEFGSLAGLVTMEDLVESVLGIEIVDETDRVVDLREEALAQYRLRQEKPYTEGD